MPGLHGRRQLLAQHAVEARVHVAAEAQGVARRDEIAAVLGQVFVHVDYDEVAQVYPFGVAALGPELELADRTDRQDEDDALAPRRLRREIDLHEVVGEAPGEGRAVRDGLEGYRAASADIRFGNGKDGIKPAHMALGDTSARSVLGVEEMDLGRIDGQRDALTLLEMRQRRQAGDDLRLAEPEEDERVGPQRLQEGDVRRERIGIGGVLSGKPKGFRPHAEDEGAVPHDPLPGMRDAAGSGRVGPSPMARAEPSSPAIRHGS